MGTERENPTTKAPVRFSRYEAVAFARFLRARGPAELLPRLDDSRFGRTLQVFAEFAPVAGHLQCYLPHWLSAGPADKNATLLSYSLHWRSAGLQGKGVTSAPESLCRGLQLDRQPQQSGRGEVEHQT